MVKKLITNKKNPADPNHSTRASDHVSPFIEATYLGRAEMIKVMLNESIIPVNLGYIHSWKFSVLQAAVLRQEVEVVKVLLDAAADPNGYGPEVSSHKVVTTAARKGNLHIMQLLVDNGADIIILSQSSAAGGVYKEQQRDCGILRTTCL